MACENIDCAKLQDILADLSSALDKMVDLVPPLGDAVLPCARSIAIISRILDKCCAQDDNNDD